MRIIPLTKGQSAIVDDEDFDSINQWKWQASRYGKRVFRWVAYRKEWYTGATGGGRTVKMHRFILNAPKGTIVDHRNGNPLDNRKENLRLCDSTQNQGNKRKYGGNSRFKGVYWDRHRNNWRAKIEYRGVRYTLGRFRDERTAAAAYNEKARELFGDFALLNAL